MKVTALVRCAALSSATKTANTPSSLPTVASPPPSPQPHHRHPHQRNWRVSEAKKREKMVQLQEVYANVPQTATFEMFVKYSQSQWMQAVRETREEVRNIRDREEESPTHAVASDTQLGDNNAEIEKLFLDELQSRQRAVHGHLLSLNYAAKALHLNRFPFSDQLVSVEDGNEGKNSFGKKKTPKKKVKRVVYDDILTRTNIRLEGYDIAQLLYALNGNQHLPVTASGHRDWVEEMRSGAAPMPPPVAIATRRCDLQVGWKRVPEGPQGQENEGKQGGNLVFRIEGTCWNESFSVAHDLCHSSSGSSPDAVCPITKEFLRTCPPIPAIPPPGLWTNDGRNNNKHQRGSTTTTTILMTEMRSQLGTLLFRDMKPVMQNTVKSVANPQTHPLFQHMPEHLKKQQTDSDNKMFGVLEAERWAIPSIELSDPAQVIALRNYLEKCLARSFGDAPLKKRMH